MKVEISPGEAADKLTILEIKRERISDPEKRANVVRELEILTAAFEAECSGHPAVAALQAELKTVNETLWGIEDALREHEKRRDFGPDFIELARAVYFNNDRRSALKRRINEALQSPLIEEKSYTPY